MVKRPRRQGPGLLDLPAEALDLILSFLGTLSLASVRLVCRALWYAATRGRRGRVVLRSEVRQHVKGSMYAATAHASPRVLSQMHAFQALMDRVVEDQNKRGPRLAARPDQAAYEHFMTFLQIQLLASVAGEVVSLEIRPAIEENYYREDCLALDAKVDVLLRQLHVLLPQMRQLESLRLEGPLHSAVLQELPALPHLTSLKVGHRCSETDIQRVCDTLALSRLDLGWIDMQKAFDCQSMLAVLASGKVSGLQELVLPFPAAEMQHLSSLCALTALTALHLQARNTPADLAALPSISGLKSLCVERRQFFDDIDFADLTLAPLSALTGLTLLDLNNYYGSSMCDINPPPDVSVFSALTALRVLRCSFFHKAEVVAGDPLPVQLRFLRTAPALEVLDLGFFESFWLLPDASIHAVREAVRGLLSVKQITVFIEDELELYYLPLSAFAAASSIETLTFIADGRNLDGPADSPAQARDCFSALTKLRSLFLGRGSDEGRVPHCADLLAGLPSPHLTSLRLSVSEPDVSLVREIARFRDLQSLSLASGRGSWLASLGDLCHLKCLTRLEVEVLEEYLETQDPRCRRRPTSCSTGRHVMRASDLETAMREYGRRVGVPVKIRIRHI